MSKVKNNWLTDSKKKNNFFFHLNTDWSRYNDNTLFVLRHNNFQYFFSLEITTTLLITLSDVICYKRWISYLTLFNCASFLHVFGEFGGIRDRQVRRQFVEKKFFYALYNLKFFISLKLMSLSSYVNERIFGKFQHT